MSLLKYASIIRNRISPYITNTNLDINQIKDELVIVRNRLIHEYELKKALVNASIMYREVNCIPVVCKDISECCDVDSDEKVLVAEIPELMELSTIPNLLYVGTIDRTTPFQIMRGNSYLYRPYAKWTSKMKSVWYRQPKNQLILFNVPDTIKSISVTLIPKNEQDLLKYECACIDVDDVEFTAPDYLIDVIIETVANKYINQYQMAHNQSNTQSEILQKKV